MTSFFSTLVDFVHAHSQYTHIAIFLLALSEAIPVVGTVVPGSTLIIGISALATSANANSWLLLITATAGAIIGDGLSFWLGQRYHREILNSWPAFVPLVSGILRMSPLQFYAANILSALAWAPAHIFPGVLLAMALQLTIPSAEQRTILVFAGVDCCDLYYLCHALVLQGQVISTNRLTPYRPFIDSFKFAHSNTSSAATRLIAAPRLRISHSGSKLALGSHVRFGSIADMRQCPSDVCFTPADICRLVWNVR